MKALRPFVGLVLLLLFLLLPISCSLKAIKPIDHGEKIGVVLLHGKGGDSQWIDPLKSRLESVGVKVEAPAMAWHKRRIYDKSFDDAMQEIHQAVASMKEAGSQQVYVAGHSLGAIAAAGYAARYDDINGIVLLAPGHFTAWAGFHNRFVDDLIKADKLIEAGKGDEKSDFIDINAGKIFKRFVTPRIYKSWFSDTGPAEFVNNMSNIKAGIPVLYVAGSEDRTPQTKNKNYAFAKIPENPDSHFVIIDSGHLDVPERAEEIVIEWLRRRSEV